MSQIYGESAGGIGDVLLLTDAGNTIRKRVKARLVICIYHAPPVQEFGEMPTKSIMARIQSCEDKLICMR